MTNYVKAFAHQIAIFATPAQGAQRVADRLIMLVSEHCQLCAHGAGCPSADTNPNMDLALCLQHMVYYLKAPSKPRTANLQEWSHSAPALLPDVASAATPDMAFNSKIQA